MAKFAVNNHINTFTGVILFFADYGFYPCTDIEPSGTFKDESEQKTKLLVANKIVA